MHPRCFSFFLPAFIDIKKRERESERERERESSPAVCCTTVYDCLLLFAALLITDHGSWRGHQMPSTSAHSYKTTNQPKPNQTSSVIHPSTLPIAEPLPRLCKLQLVRAPLASRRLGHAPSLTQLGNTEHRTNHRAAPGSVHSEHRCV